MPCGLCEAPIEKAFCKACRGYRLGALQTPLEKGHMGMFHRAPIEKGLFMAHMEKGFCKTRGFMKSL